MTNLRHCSLFLIFSISLLLGAVPAARCQESPDPTENLSAQDQAVPAEQRVWLDSGRGKALAFYLPEKSGKAHGGVLIVPNRGEHPAVQGLIDTLRYSLADNHWHTLALNISKLDTAAVQDEIRAGIASLNARGVFNIAILGEGEGALHALRYIASLPPRKQGEITQIRALVMINADNGQGESDIGALGSIGLPILDAWLANDLDEQQQARERKRLASTSATYYQQARLPYTTYQSSRGENRVTKRIRGWLDKNVAGFMVDSGTPGG